MRVKLSPPSSVPAAQLAQAVSPVQQMMPTPSTQQQPISPKLQQQPFPFQPPQQKPLVKSRSEADRVTNVKEKWDELEQDFRAEFEKSAELLLRPYIAQWLDEHFIHSIKISVLSVVNGTSGHFQTKNWCWLLFETSEEKTMS